MDHGSKYRRSGCRDQVTGRPLGARCSGLSSPQHGLWYFSMDLRRREAAPGAARRARNAGGGAARLEKMSSTMASPEPGLATREWLWRWLESRVSLKAVGDKGLDTPRLRCARARGALVCLLS